MAKTRSINSLAEELGIDRRTLTRRLEGLDPAKSRHCGNRVERSYFLSDVVDHLAHLDNTTLELERTRLTKAQADKTELEVLELRGNLIRMSAVAEHWQGMISAARAKFLALAPKLAVRFAAPDKIAEAQDGVQALIFEALAELAGDGLPPEVEGRIKALERSSASVMEEVVPPLGELSEGAPAERRSPPSAKTSADSPMAPGAAIRRGRDRHGEARHTCKKTTRKSAP